MKPALGAVLMGLLLAGLASPAGAVEVLTRAEKTRLAAIAEDRRAAGRGVLLGYLADPDWMVRRRALLGLARLQDPTTVHQVSPLLNDESARVRESAAYALGQIGDSTAVGPLITSLGDRSPGVVRAVAQAMGKLGSGSVAAPLVGLLGGEDDLLTGEALLALARLGPEHVRGDLPQVVDGIRRQLEDRSHEIRWRAAYALEKLLAPRDLDQEPPAEALEALREVLKDDHPLPRLFALRALGRATEGEADEQTVRAASELLSDPDWRVAVEAARALGRTGGERSVASLATVVGRAEISSGAGESSGGGGGAGAARWHLRAAALEALADAGTPRGIELAKPFLTDLAPGLRWRAARALVVLGSLESLPRLVELLQDPEWRVRAKVASVLGESKSDEVAAILLSRLGEEEDVRVRAGLAAGLTAIAAPQTLPEVSRLMKAPDPVVAAVAAEGVAAFGDTSVAGALGELLHTRRGEEWSDARLGAVEALGELGGERAVSLLEEALKDSDEHVADRAAEGLRRLTGRRLMPAPAAEWMAEESDYPPSFGGDAPWEGAVIHTSRGDIEVELAGDAFESPVTVHSFAWQAARGYFDGLTFHRVVPDFVIQGGCPRGDGWGGPGYRIRCEINRHRYLTGAVGMALAGKDTGGSQFFITHSPQPRLDGRYTIFGQVVRGQETVDAIREGDRIESVELIPRTDGQR